MVRRIFPLAFLGAAVSAQAQFGPAIDPQVKPRETKFRWAAPLPSLPRVMLDSDGNGIGLAQTTARAKNLQARILWIDATANLERVNSAEKIAAVVGKAKASGFNTIVFDVKPIVGYTLYPSKFTEKLPFWRDGRLPRDFDPLKIMVAECREQGIPIYASMNTFSEGHRMAKEAEGPSNPFFKPGPGYGRLEDQTVLYEPVGEIRPSYGGPSMQLADTANQLPRDGQRIGVFVRGAFPKEAPAGAYAAVVDRDGIVVATAAAGAWTVPGIPEGGSALIGTGNAAVFLAEHGRPGRRFLFRSTPSFVPISARPEQQIPLMMNPVSPAVQSRVLDFVREIASNYAVNGVIFDDRLRYGNVNADFSEITRAKFEEFVGEKLNWPQDVFEFTVNPDLTRGVRPGKWYDTWFAWRAQVMRDWVARAAQTVREARSTAQLGVYAGSWYGEYVRYGNNWASPKFRAGFTFLNDAYRTTGYAPLIDFLITGCYYDYGTISDAMQRNQPTGRTVEAAGQLTNRGVRDECWAYAGISLANFKNRPRALMDALQAACGSTQGVMVFDLSHDIEPMWPVFAQAFGQRKAAPHSQPGLIHEIRALRAKLDAEGYVDPPVTIREGASGAGL